MPLRYAKLGFLREANQFSSSTVKNRGRPTGDALNDNARMLTETRYLRNFGGLMSLEL